MSAAMVPFEASKYGVFAQGADTIINTIHENLGEDGIRPSRLDRVKIPSGGVKVWTIPGLMGEENTPEIKGVILHHFKSRLYWENRYAGEKEKPNCYSPDAYQGYGDPGILCQDCPFSKFESAQGGGRGQACKLIRNLFVLRPGEMLPIVMALPPTSIMPMDDYLFRLTAKNIPFYGVETSFTLDRVSGQKGVPDYSKVVVKPVSVLAGPELATMTQFRDALLPFLKAQAPRVALNEDEN